MNNAFLLLLDSAPLTWTSQEDRHLLLCRELSARRIQPVLVFAAPLKSQFGQRFVDAGARVYSVSYSEGAFAFRRKLRRIIKENRITLVHVIFFDYFSPIAWIVRTAGVKHIVYEMQNSGIFRATSWKRFLLRLRTKIMTLPMVRVIAISKFVKEQLVNAGVPSNKIIVRYLGVCTERFTPDTSAREYWTKTFDIRPQELILSTVSYLRPFKNPNVLVYACRELKNRNVPVRLFVAGDGEMLPDLKDLSRELDVSDRIHWLGNVEDPKSLLQASDMFLLASTGEAFGLVLAEAMACGIPIVGTRSGSLPEVVEEGKSGLLVQPRDAQGLASAVELLANDRERLQHMSDRALDRVKEFFSVQQAVAGTLAIYDDVLAGEKKAFGT